MGVENIIGELGRERGARAENSASRALASHKLPEWFTAWTRSPQYSEPDQKGIDLTAHTDVGDIYLQVKSSAGGAKTFRAKHPKIPVVVIKVGKPTWTHFQRHRERRWAGAKTDTRLQSQMT